MGLKKCRVANVLGQLGVIDQATGEVIGTGTEDRQGTMIFVPTREKFKRSFAMIFQDMLIQLAKDNLTGNDLRVLMVMMGTMDYENQVGLRQKQIAELLGMRKQHVSSSVRKLIEMGYLLESDNVYYLAHLLVWKGRVAAFNRRVAAS